MNAENVAVYVFLPTIRASNIVFDVFFALMSSRGGPSGTKTKDATEKKRRQVRTDRPILLINICLQFAICHTQDVHWGEDPNLRRRHHPQQQQHHSQHDPVAVGGRGDHPRPHDFMNSL